LHVHARLCLPFRTLCASNKKPNLVPQVGEVMQNAKAAKNAALQNAMIRGVMVTRFYGSNRNLLVLK
jgi:hypothetical protein